jgi:arylsulfatase A
MGHLTRREFMGVVGAGAAALAAPRPVGAAEASARPNILFIMADDLGIEKLSCYGGDSYKTPNIDRLAQTGIRFETCYSTPLCGPTRCQLMTGRYPFRTGGLTNGTAGQPRSTDETTFATVLRKAGYGVGMAGKWRQMGELPGDWGFQEYITDPTAGGWYWQTSYTKNGQLVELDKEIYYEDEGNDFAIDFMKRHRDGPFLFYRALHLVHAPILRTPDSKSEEKGQFYADNVAYMDKKVGQLVDAVDQMGLREKTVIIFTADNGTAGVSGTIGGKQIHGAKGSMWEGGSRVALIGNWKGTAPEGRVLRDMVDCSDFSATFCDLAGTKMPETVPVDGRSFAPQLRGQAGKPREWIFVQLSNNYYVREQGWKLNQAGELYDMKNAPFEERLVAADAQDADAAAARKRLKAALDTLNPGAGKTISPEQQAKERAQQKKRAEKQKALKEKGEAPIDKAAKKAKKAAKQKAAQP